MYAGYRHVQLRSSSNQPLDVSTLFICCKLEDDSTGVHTADFGVGAAAMGEFRGSLDATGSAKRAASRGTTAAAMLRSRDDSLPATVEKEVRHSKT